MPLHEADHYADGIISQDVVRSYSYCRYKAFLKLSGEVGPQCAYETALAELRAEARERAIGKLKQEAAGSPIPTSIEISLPTLCLGHRAIIDGELSLDGINVRVDGLRRAAGRSQLGDFHYEPLLFHEGPKAREPQRMLLSVIALLVSRLQGKLPDRGVIYQGCNAATSAVRMAGRTKSAESILDDLIRMRRGEVQPKLVLNNHCGVCEFQQRCHLKAIREDNLSLLRGVSQKDITRYARRGVLTLTQFAYTFRPRRESKSPGQRKIRRYHALQALAIRDQRLYVFGTPAVPSTQVRIFLDLEGNPHEECVYLIGMIVMEAGQVTTHTLWADTSTEESTIFEKFLTFASRFENPTIYCYGDYERAFIRRMRAKVRRKKLLDKILGCFVNVLSLIYAHFYFPTYSNGLKDIGRYLGCVWTEPGASAAQSIAWRICWTRKRDEGWKAKLIAYNLEDCAALRKVVEVLQKISTCDAKPDVYDLPVSHVRELEKLANPQNWKINQFVDPDYRFVNDRSHFDYQRQRVFVRTSKRLKTQLRKRRPQQNRHLRGRSVEIQTVKCAECGSDNIVRINPIDGRAGKSKRTFDLFLSGGTIGRHIIDYRAAPYRCVNCGAHSRAEQYERVAKYRHGLMSWAISLHIAHGLGSGTIGELIEEFSA